MSKIVADDGHGRCVPVRLSAFGAEPTQASMIVTNLPPRSRIRRSVISLAACWSAAVLALFVPFLWRMLVPALLVESCILADPSRTSATSRRVSVLAYRPRSLPPNPTASAASATITVPEWPTTSPVGKSFECTQRVKRSGSRSGDRAR